MVVRSICWTPLFAITFEPVAVKSFRSWRCSIPDQDFLFFREAFDQFTGANRFLPVL